MKSNCLPLCMFLFFKSDTSKPWHATLWLTETLSNCYSLLYSFIYFAINDPCYTMQQLNRAVNVITASSLSRRWKYGESVQQWNAVSQKLRWLLEYRRLSFMKLVHSVGQLMQRVKQMVNISAMASYLSVDTFSYTKEINEKFWLEP